jgi:hypothetical protein
MTSKKPQKVAEAPRTPPAAIVPNAPYTATECCELLKITRQTLGLYVRDRQFPLRTVGNSGGGVAMGQDILNWIAKQPVGAPKQRKVNRSKVRRAATKA